MKVLPSTRAGAENGSALLIVLAFVLLLTIVTTAFLSKALLEKTVSNASADQTRTDVFAAGAVDAILSDCQQEIAAGSTITTPSGTHTSIYAPATAKTVVPSRMAYGSSSSAIGFTNQSALPNLLKTSTCAVPFYPSSDATDFPNASSYPPNEKTFAAPDPNDSTSASSLNGRSYSATRWNQALLLPKADLTTGNYTNYLPNSKFTVPDWILVQRDGSNPTVPWSSALTITNPTDVTTATKNPVVGRYAYAIYDEGGLLDMNVAGFRHESAPANQTQRFYRSSLASVDLTQLAPFTAPSTIGTAFMPSSSSTVPTNTLIDSIIGWRNFATLQATGTMPSYTVSATNATNYFQNVQPPGTGFLHTTVPTSPAMTFSLTSSQTDRKFSSRQQLINLLMNDVAQTTTDKANLQNALQYMGTFSRDLLQPSYQPDANRPRMSPGASGDPASNGGNAAGTDDSNNYINVPFASTLVQTAYTRNDGSPANVGDPLVKKRFALNRLAWLTFLGPIADDNGNLNNNSSSALYVAGNAANFTAIINALETQYGLTQAFLARGGPTNIAKYFGLTWKQDSAGDGRYKWFYNVHNNSSGTTGKGIIRELGGPNGIAGPNDTSTTAHDPDFFELLKATMLAGSKGRTLTYLSAAGFPSDIYNPLREQYNADVSFDFQVLQVGANIIDQFDTDSYATEIVFDNGAVSYSALDDDSTGEPKIIRGVENLPYLYRVRTGNMILRNPNTVVGDAEFKTTTFGGGPYTTTNAAYANFKDTGVAALMELPEIWDPFDVNAPTGSGVVAYPSTGSGQTFRLIADSADPSTVASGAVASYTKLYADAANTFAQNPLNQCNPPATGSGNDYAVNTTGSVPFTYSLNGAGGAIATGFSSSTAQALTASTTELDFNAPTSTLYREPTLLSRPNLPSGSGLKYASGFPGTTSDLYKITNSTGTQVWSSTLGGFIADTRNANPLSLSAQPTTNAYLGVVLGLYPLQWAVNYTGNCIYDATMVYPLASGGSNNVYITYRLQYRDPNQANSSYSNNWVTYDEKYMNLGCSWTNGNDGFLVDNQATADVGNTSAIAGPATSAKVRSIRQQSGSWQGFADPRSSRFGTFDLNAGYTTPAPVYYSSPQLWLDQPNGVMSSDRPDSNFGFAISTATSNYAFLAPGWIASTSQSSIWWGPTSVNTESQTSGTKGYRFGSVSNPVIANDTSTPGAVNQNQSSYYSDSDGVVRRAMGGNVAVNSSQPTYLYGYPMATATTGPTYTINANQSKSRPYILNRPFRMVGELGYVFSGTPWKNLDFTNPESGDSPLLDVFCINDTDDPNALVAGKVNLNTQQVPVLATILSEAYYDDVSANKVAADGYINSTDAAPNTGGSAYTTAAYSLANLLVNGGTSFLGTSVTPLTNVRELVGKYVGSSQPAGTLAIDGTATGNYSGYGGDIGALYTPGSGAAASYYNAYNTRFREAAVRALSAVGQTRVWNLMIDVVAQTGRYPATATNASNFIVEGERRYWVHVAIDRYTGNILDRQIEEVRQ